MKTRRFALVVPQFPLQPPPPPGEDYFSLPAQMMSEDGFAVEIFALRRPQQSSQEQIGQLVVRRFDSRPRLLRMVAAGRFDIIHAHSHFLPALLTGLVAWHTKTVFTSHSYDLPRTVWKRRVLITLMNRFDRVIALSPFERDVYLAGGVGPSRVVVLGLPINVPFFSAPGNAARWNIPAGAPVILFNANLRPVKNPQVVVAAFQRVRQQFPEARLLLVGRDFMGTDYASLPGVILTDWQPAEVVRDALAAASVVVNSSTHESFSLSSFEAAAAGRPLCLPDLGSLRSLFGENALYHPPLDEVALAANIVRYLCDPALCARHVAANREMVARYDSARVLPEYIKLYESVAGQ